MKPRKDKTLNVVVRKCRACASKRKMKLNRKHWNRCMECVDYSNWTQRKSENGLKK